MSRFFATLGVLLMDFLVQDAGTLYPDFFIFPNELLYLFSFLFIELVIIFVFLRYFVLWLWVLPLDLA